MIIEYSKGMQAEIIDTAKIKDVDYYVLKGGAMIRMDSIPTAALRFAEKKEGLL